MRLVIRLSLLLVATLFHHNSLLARQADSLFVVQALSSAPANAGTLHFARLFLGRPYVAHTLEVHADEQLVVNTRQLDCTTFVENVAALTLCAAAGQRTYNDFCNMLQRLRYRDGRIDGYDSRLHYFSDWIDDNSHRTIVAEVQSDKAPFTAVQTLNLGYMSTHPQAYKALRNAPALVALIAKQERRLTGRRYRYIPKTAVQNTMAFRQVIHDGDILAITTTKAGLDIAHLGFAVWQTDGLHLLNASQIHKKVVEEPMTLGQYLQKHPSHSGIRVVRLNTGSVSHQQ